MHRYLEVFGNPLGCVQGAPDSVTYFDNNAVWYGYYETARCGDNCTEHTVYVPSNGVCVQCPDGTHAHGVGALNCSVLSPVRCSLAQLTCCSVLQCCCVLPVRCNPPVAVSSYIYVYNKQCTRADPKPRVLEQKSPISLQKSHTSLLKSPIYIQHTCIYTHFRCLYHRKRALGCTRTRCVETTSANTKEPYTTAKEPYVTADEPHFEAKKPYITAKEPYVTANEH